MTILNSGLTVFVDCNLRCLMYLCRLTSIPECFVFIILCILFIVAFFLNLFLSQSIKIDCLWNLCFPVFFYLLDHILSIGNVQFLN